MDRKEYVYVKENDEDSEEEEEKERKKEGCIGRKIYGKEGICKRRMMEIWKEKFDKRGKKRDVGE